MYFLTRIAPVQDVNRALDRGTLGSLNPTPWAVMTANTTAWVIYSYLIEVRRVIYAFLPYFLCAKI